MRILIINTVVLNGGDAAILQATVDLLRSEFGRDTSFVIHESQPEVASRYYPEFDLRARAYQVVARASKRHHVLQRLARRMRLNRFRFVCEAWTRGMRIAATLLLTDSERAVLTDFVEADLVVTTGGTYLVEHYDFTSRVFALETARRLRRPVVFFTQSLGPFTRPNTRRSVKREIEHASLVLLRDQRSLRHLQEIGVRNTNLRVAADVVFAMADTEALADARRPNATLRTHATGDGPRVAISVRYWSHFEVMSAEAGMVNYLAAMQAAVIDLVKRYGARVTFLSTCQGIAEYFTDDSDTAKAVVAGLPPQIREVVDVDAAFHRPSELAALLRDFDLVITTRMHMGILALGAGTLVLPVAYEFKTRELFERLGLGDFVHDMEGLNAAAFVRTLHAMLDDAANLRQKTFVGVEVERRSALACAKMVRVALSQSAPRASR